MVPVEVGGTNQGMANLPEGAPAHSFCGGRCGGRGGKGG